MTAGMRTSTSLREGVWDDHQVRDSGRPGPRQRAFFLLSGPDPIYSKSKGRFPCLSSYLPPLLRAACAMRVSKVSCMALSLSSL